MEMGVPTRRGEKWSKDTVRGITRNLHYTGKVVFNKRKATVLLEQGERVVKRVVQPEDDVIIAEGKHPAIIDEETWEAKERTLANMPKLHYTRELRNPLSGVIRCAKCGKAVFQHNYPKAESRYECRTAPRCFKSVVVSDVDNAVVVALEQAELPALELKVKNGDGNAVKIQQKQLAKLEKQMEEYREQEEKQFDLLETGVYSQALFEKRNAALRDKMEECQHQIKRTKATMPKNVDYSEKVAALKDAIEVLKNPEATPAEKNKLLRAIVSRIEYTGTESMGAKRKGVVRGHNPFSLKIFLRL